MNNAKKAWSQPSVSAVDVKMTMATDPGYTISKGGKGFDSMSGQNTQSSGGTVTITFTSYQSTVTVTGGK